MINQPVNFVQFFQNMQPYSLINIVNNTPSGGIMVFAR
jgi:hypothetical protein